MFRTLQRGIWPTLLRGAVLASSIASIAPPSARAQALTRPQTVTPDGGSPIGLVAEAARVHLLGSVELYSVSVYAEGSGMDPAQLVRSDTAKAIRIAIRHKDDLSRRTWIDWRRELVPPLSDAAMTQLRARFAPLREGDVVTVEYVPDRGTAIRINKGAAVTGVSHDLMLAFLDHWLGQRPVSEELKRILVGQAAWTTSGLQAK